jgi:hypothetical protein
VPSASSRWPDPRGELKGQPCSGFAHYAEDNVVPENGVFRCYAACDNFHRRKSWRQAVPGTPCVGYQHEKPLQGKWRAVPAKDLR